MSFTGLPRQKLPISKKDDIWEKDTIDYYIRLSYTTTVGNRTSNYNKLINYDLFNGHFNKADLEYVCNPLGFTDNEFPATLQHYDVTSKPIELLLSEEATRPDNQMVISESDADMNRKQSTLKDKIMQMLQQQLMEGIDPSTIDPKNPPPTPEQILKYQNYTNSDLIESKANKILKYLKRKLVTKEIFKKGWKDALIAGEEIYWVGITNGEPVQRRCNPVNLTIVLDADSDFIDDAVSVVETRLLSPATIIDEYGDELTPNQITEVENMNRQFANVYQYAMGPNPTFTMGSNGVIDTNLAPTFSQYGSSSGAYNQHLIRVSRVEWKSFKKMFYISYTDEDSAPQEMMVDETFKINIFRQQYPDVKAEEFWITEAWEGTKIGFDMYIGVRPKPNQRRRLDNPYACKLGYTGYIYSATNSQSISLVDRIKPYQYLYNIFMYRLELAFAQDQGKKFIMDLAQIPRSEGMDLDRWMYYLKAMGIAFINSHEEGKKGSMTGKISNFNQFQSIDLSMANTIQQYIQTLDYIHQQIYFISGVSPQRLGAVNKTELVGNVEQAIQQSSLITEHLFDIHDEVKRRTYTALIEAAKIAFKNGKIAQYLMDDMGIEMLHLEEFELEDSEFGVFMSNSKKDVVIQQTIKGLFETALKMDKVDLSTVAESLLHDSTKDLVRTLERKEQEFYQRKAKEQQSEKELEQASNQAKMQIEQQKLDIDKQKLEVDRYIADTNNSTKITVAEISNYFKSAGEDDNANRVPDAMEIASHALEQSKLQSDNFHKQLEQQNKLKIESDKNKLKEFEINTKKDIEDKKSKAEKDKMDAQTKIEKLKAETAIKVAKMKPSPKKPK